MFKSHAQRKALWAKAPAIAREFERKTPVATLSKLPYRVPGSAARKQQKYARYNRGIIDNQYGA